MRSTFEAAQAFVAKWEGGLVDHPNDPGGITNRGVSLRWLRSIGCDIDGDGDIDADDIRAVTPEISAQLFYGHFWTAPGLHELPPLVAVAVYDGAVNQGVPRAVRQLQAACNRTDGIPLVEDGRLGPNTLRRVTLLCRDGSLALALSTITEREAFYQSLVARPPKVLSSGQVVDYRAFLAGWLNRTGALDGWCTQLAKEGMA